MIDRNTVESYWSSRLRLLEQAVIAWLIVSQIVVFVMEQGSLSLSHVVTSIVLLLISLQLALSFRLFFNERLRWSILFLELCALIGASLTGVVAGFELVWLLTLARAGFVLPKRLFLFLSALSVVAYLAVNHFNPQLVVQSSQGYVQSDSLYGLFLGREFLSYIVGLVLVVVISRSARRETEYRLEAEKLSKQIETLSQDLERNRVASEIKANVDHLLVALMLNVDYINKVRFQSTELAIEGLKQARALAQESLAEVRKALAMIRDFAL